VISRLLQGFSCGGELGGATAILVENAPDGRRGLYASWQVASQAAAVLLGATATMVVSFVMTPAQLLAGGWRWPFVLGLLIVPVGLYIRAKLNEPELFLTMRTNSPRVRIRETLRGGFGATVVGIGFSVLFVVSAYILFLYMPTFAVRQLGMPFAQALLASTIGAAVLFIMTPIMGALSDRLGRKPMMLAGASGFVLLTYPAFMLITASPSAASLGFVQSAFAVLMAIYGAPTVSALAELFPTRMRCTAVGLVYNVTVAFVGGTAQLIVTWLLAVTGNPLAPAFYVITAAIISAAAVIAMRDRYRAPLM
jgi:MHS family proline/betaine transporter-like MFS transporter